MPKNGDSTKETGGQPQIAVAQLGARMHYAVPRILEEAGMLHRFYTDICATTGIPKYLRHVLPRAWMPPSVKALFDRVPKGVPETKTESFPLFGLRRALRRRIRSTQSEQTADYIWAGTRFGELVNRELCLDVEGMYVFKTAALEILERCSERGVFCILEQPNVHREVMHDLMTEEHERFPKWAEPRENDEYLNEEIERERDEWENADLIVCPSTFVQKGVEEGGGPASRTVIVPYGVDFPPRPASRDFVSERPLRALMVGTVGLRKGAPYLMEAAQQTNVHFRAVGPVSLRKHGRERLSSSVDLTGRVPRSQIHEHYEWADVFVLPSICEGSATVVYEALAHALPVLCTPNTGSIVRDGIEGFVVPVRDGDALASRLDQLAGNPELYESMSKQALDRYQSAGNLKAYESRLVDTIQNALQGKK